MAGLMHKNENRQGWSVTFDPAGRVPLIGSRIFATKNDLDAYINDKIGTAIAGIQVSVVADTNANNGVYEIRYKNTNLRDGEVIKWWNDVDDETNLFVRKITSSTNGENGSVSIVLKDGIGGYFELQKAVDEYGSTKYSIGPKIGTYKTFKNQNNNRVDDQAAVDGLATVESTQDYINNRFTWDKWD